MDEMIKDLLRLYENTVAKQGYPRRKCISGVARSADDRLGHARFMVDEITQRAEKEHWPEKDVARWLGFIQGVLWSENQFSIASLQDQMRAMIPMTGSAPRPVAEPTAKPEVIPPQFAPAGDDDAGDDEDVSFVESMSGGAQSMRPTISPQSGSPAVPVRLPGTPRSGSMPVRLPD